MNTDKVTELLDGAKKDISQKDVENLKTALEGANEDKYAKVSAVKLKKLSLTTILSAFLGLFGAGDFYLGNFKRGIIKLLCGFALPLVIILTFCLWATTEYGFFKKVNVPYFALHSNIVISNENLLGAETRAVTKSEVLGVEGADGETSYNYSFSEFEKSYSGADGVKTRFDAFHSADAAIKDAKTTISNTKAETKKLKIAVDAVKEKLNGESIPEKIANYEDALATYQTQYADYESKLAAYAAELEIFKNEKELTPFTDDIKAKEEGDLKDSKKSLDEAKTALKEIEVSEKFNELITSLNNLENNCGEYSKNLSDYKSAVQEYNASIINLIPAIDAFTGYKIYYGYIFDKVEFDKAVEDEYGIHESLSQFLATDEEIINQATVLINGEAIKENSTEVLAKIDKAFGHVNGVHNQIAEYHDTHCILIPFMNILLITLMIVYFTIVAAYWVDEVFKNRDKCKKLNYDKLIDSLN